MAPDPRKYTARNAEIVRLHEAGRVTSEIATELGLSPAVVLHVLRVKNGIRQRAPRGTGRVRKKVVPKPKPTLSQKAQAHARAVARQAAMLAEREVRDAQVIRLRTEEEMNCSEIARSLDVGIETVRSALTRAGISTALIRKPPEVPDEDAEPKGPRVCRCGCGFLLPKGARRYIRHHDPDYQRPELDEKVAAQETHSSCAWCPWQMTASMGEVREAFARHRLECPGRQADAAA